MNAQHFYVEHRLCHLSAIHPDLPRPFYSPYIVLVAICFPQPSSFIAPRASVCFHATSIDFLTISKLPATKKFSNFCREDKAAFNGHFERQGPYAGQSSASKFTSIVQTTTLYYSSTVGLYLYRRLYRCTGLYRVCTRTDLYYQSTGSTYGRTDSVQCSSTALALLYYCTTGRAGQSVVRKGALL